MGAYVASKMLKAILRKRIPIEKARVLNIGINFKKSSPEARNTKIIDVVEALKDYCIKVDVTDPWVNAQEMKRQYGIDLVTEPVPGSYDGMLLAVPHDFFKDRDVADIRGLGKEAHVFFDMKSVFLKEDSDLRL